MDGVMESADLHRNPTSCGSGVWLVAQAAARPESSAPFVAQGEAPARPGSSEGAARGPTASSTLVSVQLHAAGVLDVLFSPEKGRGEKK